MWPEDPAGVRPMLASIGTVPLRSASFAYEPKYDGVRALVAIEPTGASGSRRAGPVRVRVWSRLGNEKSRQFPEIVAALQHACANLKVPVLVDGEIVALDATGSPASFLHLQGRIHGRARPRAPQASPAAFIAFDLLFEGKVDLRDQPLRTRRSRLEQLLRGRTGSTLRLSEQAVGDGRTLEARAVATGGEGLIAKRLDSRYVSGARSGDWRKLKLVRQQTCVIGGWTDPKGSRPRFGALLLGVYDDKGRLLHVGQVGAGFSDAELERVWTRLRASASTSSPFVEVPRALQRAHWVAPTLACEVKFTEWTLDGRLRHPTYLGLRDDVDPRRVRKEPQSGGAVEARVRGGRHVTPTAPDPPPQTPNTASTVTAGPTPAETSALLTQIDAVQSSSGSGTLVLPGGEQLRVTNLRKIFWPALKLTKGDLFRHYVRVAGAIMPVLADRPLVMKRYPNGVDAKPFFQHRAPGPIPAGVHVATVASSDGKRPHVIGGSLLTLLYTSQLAAISQDPWFSRTSAPDAIDAVAIDLDPPDGMPFRRVLDVALRVRDELAMLGVEAFPKTSGSRGVHVFVPMPADTPFEAGLIYAQIVATMVARKHSRHATVERSIAARGQRVYLDYLQNMRGKTLASAYSVRANAWAGVSTPLTWTEVESGVSPRDFTLGSFAERLAKVGDMWAGLRRARAANLRAVMQYAEPGDRPPKSP